MPRLWIDPSEPDYEEPKVAFCCDKCGEDILAGDDYYDCDGDRLCENCADDYFFKLQCSCCHAAGEE